MRNLFFIFLFFIIFSSVLVGATLNLNKGKLYFDLKTGEESCQEVVITASNYTDSINVRDVWANSMSEDQNLNHYTADKSNLGIKINYPKSFDSISDKQTAKVCITPSIPGQYKGAIIFTPKSDTNIVVEVGSWLFVNVTGSQIVENESSEQNQTANTNPTSITGNVVGNNSTMRNTLIIVVVAALIIIAVLIFTIRKWKRRYYYGY